MRHEAVINDEPFSVRKTESMSERSRGLLGSEKLSKNEGLWIFPCNSVHSFGMRYSLDIIYLNSDLQIRSIRKDMKPARISLDLFAKSVLELDAGAADQLGLKVGDKVVWKNNH